MAREERGVYTGMEWWTRYDWRYREKGRRNERDTTYCGWLQPAKSYDIVPWAKPPKIFPELHIWFEYHSFLSPRNLT
jgi:hypothetical protein